jgi:hypothetical protein
MSQMKQLDIIRQEHYKSELRILELEQLLDLSVEETAAAREEVKKLEAHIVTVDEFYVPDVELDDNCGVVYTTRSYAELASNEPADGDDLSAPQNGYVVLTGGDQWTTYKTLDDLMNDHIDFNARDFDRVSSVYELGAQVIPSTKTTWEEVK